MDEKQTKSSEEKKTKPKKLGKKLNPFVRNLVVSVVMLAVTAILLSAWFIFRPDNKTDNHDLFSVETISELTTLRCIYHNVAVYDEEGGAFGVGKKYVWFEYDVLFNVGIDVSKVRIEEPTDDGVVKIYLPPAKILEVKPLKETVSKPVCELGAFTEFSVTEERRVVNEGVQKLKHDEKTQAIIVQAYISAKEILEQHVINMGKLVGENYTVEWINASNEIEMLVDDITTETTE